MKLLAGTDAPTVAYTFAGFSVHDELGLFVQAGLTPMEALQTATRNPAEFLGILSSLGTVEKGRSLISRCWMRIRSKTSATLVKSAQS